VELRLTKACNLSESDDHACQVDFSSHQSLMMMTTKLGAAELPEIHYWVQRNFFFALSCFCNAWLQ
jgi:hypothetical protein